MLGIEVGLTGASGDRSGASLRSSAGRDFNIGGRIGYILAPKTLIYGKAGYTNTRSSFESIRAGQTSRIRDERNSAYSVGFEQVLAVGPMSKANIAIPRHRGTAATKSLRASEYGSSAVTSR